MKIALGSDHRGFAAKEKLKALLMAQGHEIADFGSRSAECSDYPDTAFPAALSVGRAEVDSGILLCGTGIGMSIVANKVKGVRAAICHDELTAQIARRHNDANILCLPGDLLSNDAIRRIVDVWLQTPFDGGRHSRRVQKITAFENGRDGQHLVDFAGRANASQPGCQPPGETPEPDGRAEEAAH